MMEKTSLSAGLALRAALLAADTGATKVFPVVVDEAALPYICYRRANLAQNPVKAGLPGADTAVYEVACYAGSYAGSLALAEKVRAALDRKQWNAEGLTVRACTLTAAAEAAEADAFIQVLTFNVKV